MHKSYKKTIAILVACALIGALFCFPVSAVEPIYTGGATITIISGNFTIADGSSTVSADIDNMGDGSFRINSTGSLKSGYEYATNCTFYFSADNNYGTLKVSVRQGFGSPYQSAYNRIYDSVNNTNLGASVSYPTNTVSFTYTGYIPSSIRIASYFVASSSSGLTSYYDWSFTPIDKATNDIIANQNQNAQDIQDNQDKNTQSIIDNQNELAEQEKNEIQSSGNQATDAMDSIPNESEGFINALGTFVSTMSTTDTACSITFPAIKTPSFAGIPSATLSEEKEVDFSTAISLIPSDIMRLIQALTTIALIVFCFKELYDTISEALTRKKANSDG